MTVRHPGLISRPLFLLTPAICLACIASLCFAALAQTPPTSAAQSSVTAAQDPVALHEQKLAQARAANDTKTEILELDMLGGLLASRQPQVALDNFAQALALARTTKDRASEALTHNRTATAYLTLGQKEKALDELSQAIAIETELNDKKQQAETIDDRGLVYYFMGDRQRALDDLNRALTLFRETGAAQEEATVLSEIGGVYFQIGQFHKAIECLTEALPLLRKFHASNLANTLGAMGTAHDELGQDEEALQYLNEALATARATGLHGSEAAQLNNLSVAYANLGMDQKSLDYQNQALAVDRQWGTSSSIATDYDNLGTTYLDLGENEKALDAFNHALEAQTGLNEPLRDARIKYGMARLFLMMKQPEKAVQNYTEALAIFRKLNDRKDEAATLLFLGLTYEYLGKHRDALSAELADLSLAKSLDDPDMQGDAEGSLMEYFRRQKQPEIAIFFGLDAINSYQQLRGNMSKLDKTLQNSFTESKSSTYRILAELLVQADQLAKAEYVLDLLKEQELKEVVRGAAGNPAAKLEPVALDAAHFKGQAELAAPEKAAMSITDINLEYTLLHAKPSRSAEDDARLKLLDTQIEARNAEVSAFFRDTLYPELTLQVGAADANALLSKQRSDISLLQNTLGEFGPRVLGVRLLLGEQHAYAILVTAHTRQKIVLQATPAQIRAKALEVRDDLRSPESDPKPHLAELYAMVVTPLDPELKSLESLPLSTSDHSPVPTILWSLDGVLRYVPMAALFDGSHYMAERFNNVLFTPESFGHMTVQSRPNDARPRVLAMGLSKSYGGLPALPGVMPELEAVVHDPSDPASHGPMEGRLLSNDQFTLEALKAQLGSGSSYPVVHIASHFVVQMGKGHEEPFLLLGSEGSNSAPAISGTTTAASGRGDATGPAQPTGYQLTLSKIEDSSISFRGTHLLTLSACNTASGAAMKDGLEMDSLGMIAQQKDAEAVLATLWSVNDMSTSRLMSDFYSRWVRSPAAGKAEALRQAQISFLHGVRSPRDPSKPSPDAKQPADPEEKATAEALTHPFYWAPFVLIGNFQ